MEYPLAHIRSLYISSCVGVPRESKYFAFDACRTKGEDAQEYRCYDGNVVLKNF